LNLPQSRLAHSTGSFARLRQARQEKQSEKSVRQNNVGAEARKNQHTRVQPAVPPCSFDDLIRQAIYLEQSSQPKGMGD